MDEGLAKEPVGSGRLYRNLKTKEIEGGNQIHKRIKKTAPHTSMIPSVVSSRVFAHAL